MAGNKELQEQIKEERPFIEHYYVIEDLQKQGPLDIRKYQKMEEALKCCSAN